MARAELRVSSGLARAVVAVAFWVMMLGATLPTPLYPLYQQELGFGGFVVTLVFAIYAVGVLAALLLVGRLSDRIGRKPVLLAGLAVGAVSSLVFLLPAGLTALFAGRLLSGVSVGIVLGVATAAIVDLAEPDGQARAGLLAAAANMLGLGTGPVLAGLLADLAPAPLVLPYLVHVGMVLVVGGALLALVPETVARTGPVSWTVQRIGVPEVVRPTFVRAGTAGFAGFAVIGLFMGVSPLFVTQVLHETDHALVGLVAGALLIAATGGLIASARVGERTSLLGGCVLLAVGILVVGLGVLVASLGLVLVGAVVGGIGLGASFRAGLQAVTGRSPVERRGEVSSSFFLVIYTGLTIPVIGAGVLAGSVGLVPTAVGFSVVVAALALAAFAGLRRLTGTP